MINARFWNGCEYSQINGPESQASDCRERVYRAGIYPDAGLRPGTLANSAPKGKTEGNHVPGCRGRSFARLGQKAVAAILFAGSLIAAEPAKTPRIVSAADIFNINCATYYSTIVELPNGEDIIDLDAGDRDVFWIIHYNGRYVHVKPKTEHPGRFTNVNAVTASGNTYSFTVQDVTADKKATFDLKVIVEQRDYDALSNIQHPQFVRADLAAKEADELRKTLAQKTEELAQVKRDAQIKAMTATHAEYTWKHGKESEALGLKRIQDDGKRTYIEAHSQHAPVLYEGPDEKHPAIVNYTFEKGLYVADHVIEIGELRAGKTKLKFKREKESS